ncbi:MAG: hypothetical protein WAT39_02170 [Planctomycetota bacterium]
MTQPVSSPAARDSLRRLATPHAIDFGTRLLHRGSGGTIPFRDFLAVARDYVSQRPDQTAIYLAALVALDMATSESDAEPGPCAVAPSPN